MGDANTSLPASRPPRLEVLLLSADGNVPRGHSILDDKELSSYF